MPGQINRVQAGHRGTSLGELLYQAARDPSNKTFLEIGTWNGQGSTKCIIDGLKERNDDYEFVSLEVNKDRVTMARKYHKKSISDKIRLMHGRIIDVDQLVRDDLTGNHARFIAVDEHHMATCPNVWQEIKKFYDVVLIDGGEFGGWPEFQVLQDTCKTLIIDDADRPKNNRVLKTLRKQTDKWKCVHYCGSRNGWAVYTKGTDEFIQINKFSSLHSPPNVLFCHVNQVYNPKWVKSIEEKYSDSTGMILITGNGDKPISQEIIDRGLPKNIKRWYAQNVTGHHEKVRPIPLGLENKFHSEVNGRLNGYGYHARGWEAEMLLSRGQQCVSSTFPDFWRITNHGHRPIVDSHRWPIKEIYANFRTKTNRGHRDNVKKLCVSNKNINFKAPKCSKRQYFDDILDHKMTVCPAGNGVDTHRIYEVLYCNRVPITIRMGSFPIYDMYEKLPIIILDKPEDLHDNDLIYSKYEECMLKTNKDMLKQSHWNNLILEELVTE